MQSAVDFPPQLSGRAPGSLLRSKPTKTRVWLFSEAAVSAVCKAVLSPILCTYVLDYMICVQGGPISPKNVDDEDGCNPGCHHHHHHHHLFAQNTIKVDNGYVNEQDRKAHCAVTSAHNITSTVERNTHNTIHGIGVTRNR